MLASKGNQPNGITYVMEVVTDDVTLGSEWADSVMWVRKEVEFYQHMYSVHVHVCLADGTVCTLLSSSTCSFILSGCCEVLHRLLLEDVWSVSLQVDRR